MKISNDVITKKVVFSGKKKPLATVFFFFFFPPLKAGQVYSLAAEIVFYC